MTAWQDFEEQAPELAGRVQALFTAHRHHTMASLRRDGSPRLSGTEIQFLDGHLVLGMMGGAVRAGDLRRDPRVAVHTHTADPPPEGEDPALWGGDAKVAGIAHEMASGDSQDTSHRFRVEPLQVVHTRVGVPADHLVIEVWRPGRGVERIERR